MPPSWKSPSWVPFMLMRRDDSRASILVVPSGTPGIFGRTKNGVASGCIRAVVVVTVVRRAPARVTSRPAKRVPTGPGRAGSGSLPPSGPPSASTTASWSTASAFATDAPAATAAPAAGAVDTVAVAGAGAPIRAARSRSRRSCCCSRASWLSMTACWRSSCSLSLCTCGSSAAEAPAAASTVRLAAVAARTWDETKLRREWITNGPRGSRVIQFRQTGPANANFYLRSGQAPSSQIAKKERRRREFAPAQLQLQEELC